MILEPSRLFTKFTTQNKKGKKENQSFLLCNNFVLDKGVMMDIKYLLRYKDFTTGPMGVPVYIVRP